MERLFNKVAVFTDIHFGAKSNSKQHNQDCLDFVNWFISVSKERGADTFIFCGDWHHNRRTVDVSTLNYSYQAFKLLSESFEKCYIILGNHDIFFKEKRELYSMPYIKEFKNMMVIDEIFTSGNTTLCPWLVGDEWKKLENINSRYIFGHFELPKFLMNAMIEMPDHGTLNSFHLSKPEYVFSGHFHKRQRKNNIVYIGNAFPHNYADVWDNERGMMLLEYNGKPEFFEWPNSPKYKIVKLSELLDSPELYLDSNTYLKVNIDIEITFEEASIIKDTFQEKFNPREISLVSKQDESEDQNFDGNVEFLSIDQIILDGLKSVESNTIDHKLLIEIYNSLS